MALNPNLSNKKRKYLPRDTNYYMQGILRKDRQILSQAITLVESSLSAHQTIAQDLIEKCLTHPRMAQRIGVSGAPGVGKSTFLEAIGLHAIAQGKQIAILTIDPSSQMSKGSILGDKTRMSLLSNAPNAFIRPSPAGATLGGVERKTRETILLCETAGFDTIFVETVGVGQSEIAVHAIVDCFLLLLMPGGGDELQGIKRGIMEMADIVCINKADGDNLTMAHAAEKAFKNALHLFPQKASAWTPPVLLCSSLHKTGIAEVWQQISTYFDHVQENNYLVQNRKNQLRHWFQETMDETLKQWFRQHPIVQKHWDLIQQAVEENQISAFHAAEELLKLVNDVTQSEKEI